MKDWLFYPLVLAVIAGIVVFALGLGGPRERLTAQGVLANGYGVSGADLVQLTASPGTQLAVSEDGPARALMVQSRAEAPPSAGVFLTIPPVAEAAFAGRELAVTWRLRKDGGGEVELGYFTLGAGDSGWRSYPVTEDWQDVTLRFTPNSGEPNFDYAGLWPGTGDPDGVPIEIESVRVRAD